MAEKTTRQYRLIRNWSAKDLEQNINTALENGWQLHGTTYAYLETRNHAVTGEEIQAPMFCQAVIKPAKEVSEFNITLKSLVTPEVSGWVADYDWKEDDGTGNGISCGGSTPLKAMRRLLKAMEDDGLFKSVNQTKEPQNETPIQRFNRRVKPATNKEIES